jgi:hypothetical protein
VIATDPGRRGFIFTLTLFAGFASFVGIVLMGAAVATLDLRQEGSVSEVDTKVNTMWGGILSLVPVVLGFVCGMANILLQSIQTRRIHDRY